MFIIRRDVDINGKPLTSEAWAFWMGHRGGAGWGWQGQATRYETRKNAEAALKRNVKTDGSFRRGYAFIIEVD